MPKSRHRIARAVALCEPQSEKALRLAVHQNSRRIGIYFNQIRSKSVGAINVVDQVCELITSNRFLVVFEHAPFRLAAEDADVVRGFQSSRNKQEQKCRMTNE